MSLYHKRDRIQIIAEILGLCKNPQTQTRIRQQTNISYSVLQSCITQLLMRQWLVHVEEECEQRKLAITDKGKVFLEKWLELQRLAGIEKKRKRAVPTPNLQTIKVSSK